MDKDGTKEIIDLVTKGEVNVIAIFRGDTIETKERRGRDSKIKIN